MRKAILLFSVLSLLLAAMPVGAITLPLPQAAKDHGQAVEHSPVIGTDEDGNWQITRVDHLHYAKPDKPGKPDKPDNGDGGKPDKTSQCYAFTGVKWYSLPVTYFINPSNSIGVDENLVMSATEASAETWDEALGAELFTDSPVASTSLVYGNQDFNNVVSFGDFAQDGVIGVTTYWYIGSQLVEFDMLLDTDFAWGDATLDSGVMDLQNIITHELGHALGLGDIYKRPCSAMTMYGYSGYDEISKRDLEAADIAGLEALYQ